jgi:hypothetical protein
MTCPETTKLFMSGVYPEGLQDLKVDASVAVGLSSEEGACKHTNVHRSNIPCSDHLVGSPRDKDWSRRIQQRIKSPWNECSTLLLFDDGLRCMAIETNDRRLKYRLFCSPDNLHGAFSLVHRSRTPE